MSECSTILQEISDHLGARALEVRAWDATAAVTVAPMAFPDVAAWLDRALDARFVISVGTDLPATWAPGFRVDHIFSQDARKTWIVLRAHTGADDPMVPSITPYVRAAAWAEREFQDLLGIRAEGHPDPAPAGPGRRLAGRDPPAAARRALRHPPRTGGRPGAAARGAAG